MRIRTDIILRVYLAYAILLVFALAIVFQIWKIQQVEGEKWRAMADSLSTAYVTVDAVRGNIYSEDGRLMATSIPQYDIRMDTRADGLAKELFYSQLDSLAWHLSNLFKDRSAARYASVLRNARENGERYFLVKRDISFHQLKKLKDFPIFRRGQFGGGLIAVRHNERIYPFRELARRTIGYKLPTVQPVGLEGVYDEYIDGESGKRLMRRIAGGVWIPVNEEEEIAPVDGCDIISTLNINIQDVAHNALKKQLIATNSKWGTAILMEVKTGAIRAVVNLSRVSEGVYGENYNYAISYSSEPGSTFKLATFMAGIEDGKFNLATPIDVSKGYAVFHGLTIRDSHTIPETITMKRAFEESSNVAIAKAINQAYKSDPDDFTDQLRSMGLGQQLGLQIPGEGRTRIKDPDDKDWYGTTLPWMAHGYEVLLTPLQLLTFYNAVANDGKMVKPLFVSEIQQNGQPVKVIEPEVINDQIASPETIEKAQELLKAVVEEGTAKRLFSTVYKIAGKTGTAVIADGANGYRQGKKQYQASFCGYFPADNPQYSMLVIVSSPSKGGYYGSAIAAPVFKEIADKVYSTRPDMQPDIREQYPQVAGVLPPVAGAAGNELLTVYRKLQIPFSVEEEGVWVAARPGEASLSVQAKSFKAGFVPDLKGMGLQDALFLAENAGLKPIVTGNGKVSGQSLKAGEKIKKGSPIILKLN
ncbi:cell division protein FtsI (penicillin-binding protein 3) [Anseongella ginsenosidimutans]|uniref:Cell division protein FtsI (Penicillin-binding protein 3) n=1 Tax=Anseongella ginsenosidimutans TaxID=496056 RepID=A0A4V2UUE3_9SPHI|nr:penicillin-binding protein [Anseongella ginsenosidimutans]QEC50979.1 PASTA domain-containing protein [Anseongella ginsenosidimutans]TCS90373.1 cell division protein FtsI (penicillin-binding protein 3) [Anseongella ginsenosidimutans]